MLQEKDICFFKLINEVDDLLEICEVDTSKLYPETWSYFNYILTFITMSFFFLPFVFLNILCEEKHLTMQMFTGVIACYRGGLAVEKLMIIRKHFMILKYILKKLLQRDHDTDCVVCVQLYLKNRRKLRSGNMCYQHTIM